MCIEFVILIVPSGAKPYEVLSSPTVSEGGVDLDVNVCAECIQMFTVTSYVLELPMWEKRVKRIEVKNELFIVFILQMIK